MRAAQVPSLAARRAALGAASATLHTTQPIGDRHVPVPMRTQRTAPEHRISAPLLTAPTQRLSVALPAAQARVPVRRR